MKFFLFFQFDSMIFLLSSNSAIPQKNAFLGLYRFLFLICFARVILLDGLSFFLSFLKSYIYYFHLLSHLVHLFLSYNKVLAFSHLILLASQLPLPHHLAIFFSEVLFYVPLFLLSNTLLVVFCHSIYVSCPSQLSFLNSYFR